MRLRQVATITHDLESTLGDFRAVLGVEVAFRDRGGVDFGLTNAVMPIGDTFLEVMSPMRESTAASRFLKRRGDGGYMVVLQNFGSVDEFRNRVEALGIRIVWTADHEDIRGTHLHPKDVGGAILAVDWAQPADSWRWVGPHWQKHVRTEVSREIVAVEMTSRDPAALARRWSQVLERPFGPHPNGRFQIALERGRIVCVPAQEGESEGVSAFHIACNDPARALASARARGLPIVGSRVRVSGVELELSSAQAAAG